MKTRYLLILLLLAASGARADLPPGFADAVQNIGIDIVSGIGLLMAAGLAYWLARRIYKDLLEMTSGR